jgi:hypothetical protein
LLSDTRRNPVGCRIRFIFQSLIAALQKFFTGDQKISVNFAGIGRPTPENGQLNTVFSPRIVTSTQQ